jgi:hypothetical protein
VDVNLYLLETLASTRLAELRAAARVRALAAAAGPPRRPRRDAIGRVRLRARAWISATFTQSARA